MSDHRLYYYPYASFARDPPPLLKVAALYFDTLIILDPVGASWRRSARVTSLATRSHY